MIYEQNNQVRTIWASREATVEARRKRRSKQEGSDDRSEEEGVIRHKEGTTKGI
jgi:hypothetical protein